MTSEVELGLTQLHEGVYNYTDKYFAKAIIVNDFGAIHVQVVKGRSITLSKEVLAKILEGPVL